MPNKITIGTDLGSFTEGNIEGQGGRMEVFVKFFAWAHDDHMPIRTVIVNWGDGNMTPVSNAKYQNHKPRCQREVEEMLGLCKIKAPPEIVADTIINYGNACLESDECATIEGVSGICEKSGANFADRFGDTSGQENADACREGYFQYKHTYTCAGEGSEGWNASEGACEFKLGVQVKDNWGWCNGNHGTIGGDGSGGFYADGKTNDCEDESESKEYYDGYIYVSP